MTHDLYLPAADDVRAHLALLRDENKLPPNTLHLLVGDFHGFAGLAVFIDSVPSEQDTHDRTRLLSTSLRALADVTTVHGALLAVRIDDASGVGHEGSSWRDAFATATAAVDATNHGVYLVGRTSVGRIGGPSLASP